MARPAQPFQLKPHDRKALKELLRGGVQQVRVVLRALALVQLDAGLSAPKVSASVGFAASAIRTIARRYREQGLERALYEKQRQAGGKRLHWSCDTLPLPRLISGSSISARPSTRFARRSRRDP